MSSSLERAIITPLRTNGSTFGQRKNDILRRLQHTAEQCRMNYSGRKELASESDDTVLELCEALEDAFSYGLQQFHSAALTASSLFHNMQEIVTGNANSANDSTFWDFCQVHLTPHEYERFMSLKQVTTKYGRGMAFIRAALNENSLHRYLLTWLSAEKELQRFYSPWSLLLDAEVSKELPNIVGSLNEVLFALTLDTVDLNMKSVPSAEATKRREEPVIYAPTPIPVASHKHKNKRKANVIERPIVTSVSSKDFLKTLEELESLQSRLVTSAPELAATIEEINVTPTDPIGPELEFLKQPLPEVNPTNSTDVVGALFDGTEETACENDEDKSETSSQYSKSSSALSASHAQCETHNASLEQKLREMNERCVFLETRVAQLSLENRQLVRRLKQQFNGSGIHPSSSLATNFLITIPHATLLKSKHGSPYYSYEIHITMRQNLEYWSLNKRYREFYKLHKSLLKTHPCVAVIEFPPKKHFGNMNPVFVEERRQQLQIYLLNLVEILPQVEACKSRAELTKAFPFFRER